MKNTIKIFGIIILAVVISFAISACDTGETPETVSYEGKDQLGNEYILTITKKTDRAVYTGNKGDSYVLTIKMKDGTIKVSTGKIKEVTEGTLTLQPSVENSETFNITVIEEEITSVVGDITIEQGEIIIPRTFDIIYLRYCYWENPSTNNCGDHWITGTSIKLYDFFEGTFSQSTNYKIEISGIIDKEIKIPGIEVQKVDNNNWYWLTNDIGKNEAIGPGEFTTTFNFHVIDYNNFNREEGEIVVNFVNEFYYFQYDINGEKVKETFYQGTPDDGVWKPLLPNDTIMATIRNFSINIIEFDN